MNEQIKEKFFEEQRNRNNSPMTIKYYRDVITYFERVQTLSFCSVRLSDVWSFLQYLRDKGCSPATIANRYRGLRAFFKWCHEQGYAQDIFKGAKVPKTGQKTIPILSYAEMEKLMACVNGRNLVIILLMLECGLRRNEVCRLKKDEYYIDHVRVKGKGEKERIVPLSEYAKPYIQEWFENHDNMEITYNAIKMLFQRIRQKTGIKRLYPHLLRHTFATYYIMHGGNDFALQLILGHTTLDMVRRYVHLAAVHKLFGSENYSPMSKIEK